MDNRILLLAVSQIWVFFLSVFLIMLNGKQNIEGEHKEVMD
jgi:hypothetical protein